jgi:pimeloyl-ACP methyl ester carboxylesterase
LKRRWKILIAIVVGLALLLAVNTLIVDAETKEARVTVDGGQILSLPGGEVQVTDTVDPASGRGAPIVLIHCFGCSLHWWDRMVPLLSPEHRVIRIDLLGHGGSAKPKTGYSIPDQGRLVAAALDRLGVQGAVVVGHSLGGTVAVSLAEQASQLVDRVVLIDQAPDQSYGSLDFLTTLATTPVIGEALWRVRVDSLIEKGYEQAFAPGFDISSGFDNPNQVVDDNRAMTYTSFSDSPDAEESYSDDVPLDARMRAVSVPLMVIFGPEDQIYDAAPALAAYDDVPGARTEMIDGAGHSPNVEKTEQTAKLIEEFAAGADLPAPPPPQHKPKPKPKKQRAG